MTFVQTLVGFTPTPRFGSGQISFDHIVIDESADRGGPWWNIEPAESAPGVYNKPLEPPYFDPGNPPTYNFTTDRATLENGWYRVGFLDANGALQYAPPTTADDILNLLIAVPRIRRALDNDSLSPDRAVELAADAIARISLYTGSFFGHTLEVTDRDPDFGAPVAWRLDSALTAEELEVVAIQAALDHAGKTSITDLVSQTVRSEGREHSWQKSAQAVTARLKLLIEERDRALAVIEEGTGDSLVYYVDLLHERDRQMFLGLDEYTSGPRMLNA